MFKNVEEKIKPKKFFFKLYYCRKYPKVSKGLHYLGAGLTVCLTLARAYMKATGGRYPDGIGSGGRGETYDLKRRLPKCPKDTIPKGRSDVAEK